jgi:CDP-ribitol ribitolphosphotransferase
LNKTFLFKRIAYLLVAIFFYLTWLFPINHKKILLIMTHDDSSDGNVGATYQYFKTKNPDLIFKSVTREKYIFKINKNLFKNLFYIFISLPYHAATSKTIFMDNVFLPFSYIKLKKITRLVQLWHGTGAIKKFGLESEKGWVKKLAVDTNKNTTHFIVGSSWMKEIYKTAFGADEDKIYNIGCPRTDLFFNKLILQERREEFFQRYPELNNKKILLYAPTFRDYENKLNENKIHLDIDKLISKINNNFVLGIRLHPHITNKVNLEKYSQGLYKIRVFDFSHYKKLNTLLICCDILITDYSSIIYEYALMKKPIIFYPYDLVKFEESGRGFYINYTSAVPGPIGFETDNIIDIINENRAYDYNMGEFLPIYLENCDGNSCERLYKLLME